MRGDLVRADTDGRAAGRGGARGKFARGPNPRGGLVLDGASDAVRWVRSQLPLFAFEACGDEVIQPCAYCAADQGIEERPHEAHKASEGTDIVPPVNWPMSVVSCVMPSKAMTHHVSANRPNPHTMPHVRAKAFTLILMSASFPHAERRGCLFFLDATAAAHSIVSMS